MKNEYADITLVIQILEKSRSYLYLRRLMSFTPNLFNNTFSKPINLTMNSYVFNSRANKRPDPYDSMKRHE